MRKKFVYLFASGSVIYPAVEIVYRGYSHFSMSMCGGLCVCIIDKICNEKMKNKSIVKKSLCAGGMITGTEFVFGVIFNKILKMNVWDYSSVPFNVMGQICLPFYLVWSLLSIPGMMIGKLFDGKKHFETPIFRKLN